MENYVEIGLALMAVLLPVAFVYLRQYVKKTETKLDDKILAEVEAALAKSKEQEPS